MTAKTNVSKAPVAPVTLVTTAIPKVSLAFLVFFIFVELYYAASLFSGLSVGGSGYAPLSRFYPSAFGPSDLFANDMHAFSILWFTISLMPLAYLNRNDPAKIVRLLQTIGFVLLTMTGLLIGMKEKLASNEFSFSIYPNIALLVLLKVASKNIVPSKRDTTATPTRNATLFNALICILYFFATTLGRPDKFCKIKRTERAEERGSAPTFSSTPSSASSPSFTATPRTTSPTQRLTSCYRSSPRSTSVSGLTSIPLRSTSPPSFT